MVCFIIGTIISITNISDHDCTTNRANALLSLVAIENAAGNGAAPKRHSCRERARLRWFLVWLGAVELLGVVGWFDGRGCLRGWALMEVSMEVSMSVL